MTTDIVQLKEKGKPVYLKTHAAAIDGVAGLLVRADGSDETVRGIKNFQEAIKKGNKALNQNGIKQKPNTPKKIWSGAWYAGENQSINPSLPLQQTIQTRIDKDQPYDSSTSQGSPEEMKQKTDKKTHIVEFGGRAVVHHLETLNGTAYNKNIEKNKTQRGTNKNNNTTAKP
ncbi:hypothetical protein [Enterococcus faecalis]|uniref:hypothetical protein n=1 Tax=Enterococcus faecalis TaxID=1351 RepID=UPI000447F71D|nr:hypothetical protein [Enterococcus faecalis]ETU20539.1 hypothetical protein P010_00956 [Enterococcus faecalis EnGen0410]